MHDIPRAEVKPTSESDKVQMTPDASCLNPEAKVYQLRREGCEEDAENEVQSLSGEAKITENLPVDEQNDPADDLPVEEDPGVEKN